MNKPLKEAYTRELAAARAAELRRDWEGALTHLARAHILSQRFAFAHTAVHLRMLRVGWRRHDVREVLGQLSRSVAALCFSRLWVPMGNTGRANVSAFCPMPVPADLAPLLRPDPAGRTRPYQDRQDWQTYWDFFPERVRARRTSPPQESWWPWRGMHVHLDRYEQTGAPATVILIHGAGGYGRLLGPYAQLLQDMGYEVVAPDLPGYGLSRAPASLFDYGAWVECISELVAVERQRRNRPVVLLGASIGGYLAYLVAARGAPVDAVIATTLADPRQPLVRHQFARNRLQSRLGVLLLPLLDQLAGNLELPIKWFCKMNRIANDVRLAELITRDPLGGGNRVRVHFMRSLFAVRPDVEPDAFAACPVLLVHPAADRWTTIEASRLLFDRLQGPKELVLLAGCGHFPVEEPGLAQLEQVVGAWLARVALKKEPEAHDA